jgi:hypothetical protein
MGNAVETDLHVPIIPLGRRHKRCTVRRRRFLEMLWTIIAILLILWVLGLVTSYTLGGFLHILLVIAVILLIIRLVSGRRVV